MSPCPLFRSEGGAACAGKGTVRSSQWEQCSTPLSLSWLQTERDQHTRGCQTIDILLHISEVLTRSALDSYNVSSFQTTMNLIKVLSGHSTKPEKLHAQELHDEGESLHGNRKIARGKASAICTVAVQSSPPSSCDYMILSLILY